MILLLRNRCDVLIGVQRDNVTIQNRDLMVGLADLKSECLLFRCLCPQNGRLNIKIHVRTPANKAREDNVPKTKPGPRPPWMNP